MKKGATGQFDRQCELGTREYTGKQAAILFGSVLMQLHLEAAPIE